VGGFGTVIGFCLREAERCRNLACLDADHVTLLHRPQLPGASRREAQRGQTRTLVYQKAFIQPKEKWVGGREDRVIKSHHEGKIIC
jgi:hypothetical protein